jgi:hypothetical protein
MATPRVMRRSLRLSPLLWLLSLGACTSVLGIEDIHDGPRPDAGGDASTGGTSSTTGGKNTTAGSANPNGGSVNPEAGDGNQPGGGTNGTAGTSGTMTDAGAGGAPAEGPVHGKVIDPWGAPLASIPLQIGDAVATTDAQGEFTFDDVPARYEVSFTIHGGNPNVDYGWVYQGLTRRDPTLQVYNARQAYEAPIVVKTSNVGTPGPADTITAAFGMPSSEVEDQGVDSTYAPGETVNVSWLGATTSTGTAHALLWSTASASNPIPAKYKAYASKSVGLTDGMDDEITFDLTPGTLTAGNISGTISGGVGDRSNKLFARFESNANIELMHQDSAPNTFSYLVPTLPKASITIAAIAGAEYGPIGVAHADGLAQGDTSIKLTIPVPATPKTPKGVGAKLAADRVFSFTPGAGNDGPFVIFIERRDRSYFSMYIVTADTQVTLPSVLGDSFTLLPGAGESAEFGWGIETHGDYKTVDEMAGPTGFIDSFGDSWGTSPTGPTRQDGSFTYSGTYVFTVGP